MPAWARFDNLLNENSNEDSNIDQGSVCLISWLSAYLNVHPSVYWPVCLLICLSQKIFVMMNELDKSLMPEWTSFDNLLNENSCQDSNIDLDYQSDQLTFCLSDHSFISFLSREI